MISGEVGVSLVVEDVVHGEVDAVLGEAGSVLEVDEVLGKVGVVRREYSSGRSRCRSEKSRCSSERSRCSFT